jgi:hypothetical protein
VAREPFCGSRASQCMFIGPAIQTVSQLKFHPPRKTQLVPLRRAGWVIHVPTPHGDLEFTGLSPVTTRKHLWSLRLSDSLSDSSDMSNQRPALREPLHKL